MPVHASTVLARSPASILSHISSLSNRYSGHSLMFALSSNVNAPELSKLVHRLTTFSTRTIGCLSAPLPGVVTEGLISCSLAVFDNRFSTIFRSTIPGKAAVQVGRWHAYRKREDPAPMGVDGLLEGSVNWEDVWGRNTGDNELPPELCKLSPNEVDAVIYFSDLATEGLSNSLVALPHATKFGLVASSTPFVTGRPVTLFHNQNVYSSGAIGVALTKRPKIKPQMEFMGIQPLSPPLTVTRSEGNLITELNAANPTQLLLSAIRRNGMDMTSTGSFKDDEKFSLGALRNNVLSQVYNITSGDPSRGSIALESDAAPVKGTQVQFFHRPRSATLEIPKRFYQPHSQQNHRTLGFLTTAESPSFKAHTGLTPPEPLTYEEGEEVARVLPETFLASSENGFVLSRSGDEAESAWKCTVPGGLASLEWPIP